MFGRFARAGMCMQIALNSSLFLLLFRCYECNEELSTHCNKKVLAQIVDFLQKHGARAEPSKFAQLVLFGGNNKHFRFWVMLKIQLKNCVQCDHDVIYNCRASWESNACQNIMSLFFSTVWLHFKNILDAIGRFFWILYLTKRACHRGVFNLNVIRPYKLIINHKLMHNNISKCTLYIHYEWT